jgi:hypothetical protein
LASTFLRAHWDAVAACDFFTVEVLTWTGLTRFFYVLFVIALETRRIEIAGIGGSMMPSLIAATIATAATSTTSWPSQTPSWSEVRRFTRPKSGYHNCNNGQGRSASNYLCATMAGSAPGRRK